MRQILLSISLVAIVGCGGGGGGSSTPNPTYTIGGTVSGLNASGLVLIDGTNTVSISSGVTSFEFSSMKSTGGTYQVSIQSKPSTQTCSISNASGTVTTQSILNIAISCVNNPIFIMYDETGNGIFAGAGWRLS